MLVLRPADVVETTVAWKLAMENVYTPTALILSRQNITDLPAKENRYQEALQAEKGAYVVNEDANADVILLASGSEVSTLVEGAALLRADGILEAGLGERADARFLVVLTLEDGRAVDLLDEDGLLLAGHAAEGHGALAGLGGVHVHALVHVAVGMTGDGDGLFPVLYDGMDGVDADGRAEHGAVQNGANRAVGALPHLL